MTEIKVRPGIPIERTLKRFKRKLEAEGFFEEIRKRRYFMTKNERRRLEKKRAIRRIQKERAENVER